MTRHPHVVLMVPHGFAVRNFLLTGCLEALSKRARVTVVHPLGPELARHLPGPPLVPGNIAFATMPVLSEGPAYLVRRSALLGHMETLGTVGMRYMLDHYRPRGRWGLRRLVDQAAWALRRRIGSHQRLARADRLYSRLVERRPGGRAWRRLLEELRPDVVLATDQRTPDNAAVTAAGRHLDIPVGTFVFSWDNLSSKGRMPAAFDFYCVWSRQMADELLAYYPGIDPTTVHVTGTPQFTPLVDPRRLWSRERLFHVLGADPDRPLVCFTGEDPLTDPENPLHLEMLARQIDSGVIPGRPQLLLRPAPWDGRERWREVLDRHPEILWAPARWRRPDGGVWSQTLPTLEDVELLVSLAHHAACAVNLVSTITLDFAIAGRPTVNIAFDVTEPPVHGMPVWDKLFQFEHYAPVLELGASLLARSPEEMARQVTRALADPDVQRPGRDALVRLETGGYIRSAPWRLASCLLDFAAS